MLEAGAAPPNEVLAAVVPKVKPMLDGLRLVLGAVLLKAKPGAVDPKLKAELPVAGPAVVAVEPEVAKERLGISLSADAAAAVLSNDGEVVLLPKMKPDADASASVFRYQLTPPE